MFVCKTPRFQLIFVYFFKMHFFNYVQLPPLYSPATNVFATSLEHVTCLFPVMTVSDLSHILIFFTPSSQGSSHGVTFCSDAQAGGTSARGCNPEPLVPSTCPSWAQGLGSHAGVPATCLATHVAKSCFLCSGQHGCVRKCEVAAGLRLVTIMTSS